MADKTATDAPIEEAEVEAPEVVTTRGLVPTASTSFVETQQREAGLNALSRMDDFEFMARLDSLKLAIERFRQMMREVLTKGKTHDCDLMEIEGVDRPVFTQSAAEKTCFLAKLVPTYIINRAPGTPPDSPAIAYLVACQLHLGNADGPVTAEGVGSCNSHERKYRWRYAEKSCPACGVVGSLLHSKHKDDRGPFAGTKPYFCWTKKGGCNAKFSETDERITKQKIGQVENPEPYDLDNTLLKMAKKRAFVDAAKTATCASGMVTQDLEENIAGTPASVDLREAIFRRAKLNGWTTLGPLLELARRATGKPVRTKAEFDKLSPDDLAKVYETLPVSETEKKESDDMKIEDDFDGRGEESPHGASE